MWDTGTQNLEPLLCLPECASARSWNAEQAKDSNTGAAVLDAGALVVLNAAPKARPASHLSLGITLP